jgi:hypothetical protein
MGGPRACIRTAAGDPMLFDDRLATVLRSGAAGERAARTQFRQLLDLLGSTPSGAVEPLVEAAYRRLGEIGETLPATEQSQILREPGLRLRNVRLVEQLAQREPQAAAAAMATARLSEDDWCALIPDLPVTARGFLRHRRDLPESAKQLLARLGVGDLVLPRPESLPVEPDQPAPPAEPPASGIGELVKRIEAFRRERQGDGVASVIAPRLPLGDSESPAETGPLEAFDFSTDTAGTIDWAEAPVAPLLVGLRLAGKGAAGAGFCDAATDLALRRRLTVRGGHAELPGARPVAGVWCVDAAPYFESRTGIFRGFRGRMRRPLAPSKPRRGASSSDRMREVLHELRTPVNAIQGFAEIIQQQLFGPAPNAYRALAAAVGVDAARLLAGFDELDRLSRLETAALDLSDEGCNFLLVAERTLRRLEGVTRPRSAHLRLLTSGDRFAVRLGEDDSALLAWRLLASLAGALAPGEVVELALRGSDKGIELKAELPAGLAGEEDLFSGSPQSQAPAISAGMFGSGFTFRLARAEAEAAGGELVIREERLILILPCLTGAAPGHSQSRGDGASAAA